MMLLAELFNGAALDWDSFKTFIERWSAIGNDAVHVLVGGLGVLAVALIIRRSIAEWLPWLIILAAALLNEAVDLSLDQWPDRAMQYGETAKDIFLTMAFPTALFIVARRHPRLLRPRYKPPRK